jgi:MBG domain-containing protein
MLTVVSVGEAGRLPQPSRLPVVLVFCAALVLPLMASANNPRPALVTLSGLVQPFDGAPKSVTATTQPAGLPVSIVYDGSSAAPSNSGSYTVTGIVTDPRFQGMAKDTLTISPSITNVAIPASGTYTPGQTLSFLVAFNVPITVQTILGSPTLPLTIGTNKIEAALGGVFSNALSFQYTIQPRDNGALTIGTNLITHNSLLLDLGGQSPVLGFSALDASGITISAVVASPLQRSVLKLQQLDDATIRISIQGATNTMFVIETSDDLAAPNWHLFGSAQSDGTGSAFYDAPQDQTASAHFFRAWNPAFADGPPR